MPANGLFQTLLRIVFRLGLRVRAIQEKRYHLFEYFFSDIHGAVNAIARLYPIHLANCDLPLQRFPAIAEFDIQHIPAENYGDAMKRVAMPGSRLAGLQPQSPHEVVSAMMQHLLLGGCFHDRGIIHQVLGKPHS